MVYFLIMVFFGFIIGGFTAGNNTFGIIGIVGVVFLTVFGLTTNYLKHKKLDNSVNEIFNYVRKIDTIKNGGTAFFTISEISSGIVNLLDAQKNLSEQEYFYVLVVYKMFEKNNKTLQLDYHGFLGVCDEIIAHFDLVAPFYKFCGNDGMQIGKLIDSNKTKYRIRAKKLIEENKMFKEEWQELHDEFLKEFYS